MLNPLNILSKFIKSGNQRELDKLQNIVNKINKLEEGISKLNDSEFPEKTQNLKNRLQKGESIDNILPEAFAVVREVAKRTLNMRHFDVQLIGGISLHLSLIHI